MMSPRFATAACRNRPCLFAYRAQIEIDLLDGHAPRFDFRVIEHVIDDGEQGIAVRCTVWANSAARDPSCVSSSRLAKPAPRSWGANLMLIMARKSLFDLDAASARCA